MNFDQFFKTAMGNENLPYDYQRRLACGDKATNTSDDVWLQSGTRRESKLISIPTGLGKTAAVVMAWLWNRTVVPSLNHQTLNPSQWPRRLVYCLPMRTLVEQANRSTTILLEITWTN